MGLYSIKTSEILKISEVSTRAARRMEGVVQFGESDSFNISFLLLTFFLRKKFYQIIFSQNRIVHLFADFTACHVDSYSL